MARVYNFSAGPAAMPLEVLKEAQEELLDYHGIGYSVLEMSHRSPSFQDIIDETEATLRRLLNIPDTYHVLFLQGGATLQFSAVPMNLMRTGKAGYIVSGNWSKNAWLEAARYGDAQVLASGEKDNFSKTPELTQVPDQSLDYVYFCQNETVFGTMRREVPAVGTVPVVADVSSCFLSMPLDVERYGLIYAGAQKNAGPAGVTVVIVRDDLVGDGPALADITPKYMGYRLQCDKNSMYNTPNTFGIYLCGKVFSWIEKTGGLAAMEQRNWQKVKLLYDYLDQSALFKPTVDPASRSIANVCFRTGSQEVDSAFIEGAKKRGIVNIKGHRLVGGMRASCYNAVPEEGVRALVSYMQEFEAERS
ncbi:MAG: 3-phosphoserine/phosphohydroxythreonine transaminase [Atopobiaceae bacterium]